MNLAPINSSSSGFKIRYYGKVVGNYLRRPDSEMVEKFTKYYDDGELYCVPVFYIPLDVIKYSADANIIICKVADCANKYIFALITGHQYHIDYYKNSLPKYFDEMNLEDCLDEIEKIYF